MNKHIFNIHDIFLVIALSQLLLLVAFRCVLPQKLKMDSILFLTHLTLVALGIACTLAIWNTTPLIDSIQHQHWLGYLLIVGITAQCPLLYFYVCSITYSKFTFNWKHLIHCLPTIYSLCHVTYFLMDIHDLSNISLGSDHFGKVSSLWYTLKSLPIFYSLLALHRIWVYYQTETSKCTQAKKHTQTWLLVLILNFFITSIWSLLIHLTAKVFGGATADYFGIAYNYLTFASLSTIAISYVIYTQLSNGKDLKNKTEKEIEAIDIFEVRKVQAAMEESKIHLVPNIQIEEFSAKLNLSSKTVSKIINRHFGTTYFEFINRYRIEEAKSLLADPKNSNRSVLDILLQSGFNNKSSFHRFFNRLVGVSPREYRRRFNPDFDVSDA